jgi:hypothetical protein
MPEAKMRSIDAAESAPLGRIVVEVGQVLAGPELALEFVVLGAHPAQAEELAEDHRPAHQRGEHQPLP